MMGVLESAPLCHGTDKASGFTLGSVKIEVLLG